MTIEFWGNSMSEQKSLRPNGALIGASLGPGDPGLMTRRAWDALHSDAVWAYPVRKRGGASYALDIALRAGLTPPASAMPLIFPMTQEMDILAKHWLRAAHTVLEQIYLGKDVVFLVEGDASTYSTFNHLARTVKALDDAVRIETIAGVTSYLAVTAQLQIPLADVDDTVAIVPAAYGVSAVERWLEDFDTLVLLKVKPLLDELIDLLVRRDLLAHATFVEKVGSLDERVEHDLLSLRGQKVNYLSLLLVKNPHRIKGERVRGCKKKASASVDADAVKISEGVQL